MIKLCNDSPYHSLISNLNEFEIFNFKEYFPASIVFNISYSHVLDFYSKTILDRNIKPDLTYINQNLIFARTSNKIISEINDTILKSDNFTFVPQKRYLFSFMSCLNIANKHFPFVCVTKYLPEVRAHMIVNKEVPEGLFELWIDPSTTIGGRTGMGKMLKNTIIPYAKENNMPIVEKSNIMSNFIERIIFKPKSLEEIKECEEEISDYINSYF